MIATIIESSFNINYWIASNHTTSKSIFDTFLYWFAVFLRHHATLNLVNKFKAFPWFIRLKLNPNVTILTTTTRLLNVLTLCFCSTTNSLTVSNLRCTSIGFNIMFSLQTVNNNLKMKFTHTRDNCLASFFVSMYAESWVFFGHLGESNTHLLLVSLSLWFDCD